MYIVGQYERKNLKILPIILLVSAGIFSSADEASYYDSSFTKPSNFAQMPGNAQVSRVAFGSLIKLPWRLVDSLK